MKYLTAILCVCMFTAIAGADLVPMSQSDLLDTVNFVNTFEGTDGNLNSRVANGGGVEFDITLNAPGSSTYPVWDDITIADSFDKPFDNAGFGILPGVPRDGGMLDLSGYTSYGLYFENTDSDAWYMVNVHMNTGWTDGGLEDDNYYQGDWVWLAPGDTARVEIDFATALAPWTPDNTPGVDNLNHVSDIGINVGTNLVLPPGHADYQATLGTAFTVLVSPVPAPGAVVLGAIGLGLVGWARRRFS